MFYLNLLPITKYDMREIAANTITQNYQNNIKSSNDLFNITKKNFYKNFV